MSTETALIAIGALIVLLSIPALLIRAEHSGGDHGTPYK